MLHHLRAETQQRKYLGIYISIVAMPGRTGFTVARGGGGESQPGPRQMNRPNNSVRDYTSCQGGAFLLWQNY